MSERWPLMSIYKQNVWEDGMILSYTQEQMNDEFEKGLRAVVKSQLGTRDVELASLRAAFAAQKREIEEYKKWYQLLITKGYRIKGGFMEMLDNPEFRKLFTGETGTLEGER